MFNFSGFFFSIINYNCYINLVMARDVKKLGFVKWLFEMPKNFFNFKTIILIKLLYPEDGWCLFSFVYCLKAISVTKQEAKLPNVLKTWRRMLLDPCETWFLLRYFINDASVPSRESAYCRSRYVGGNMIVRTPGWTGWNVWWSTFTLKW